MQPLHRGMTPQHGLEIANTVVFKCDDSSTWIEIRKQRIQVGWLPNMHGWVENRKHPYSSGMTPQHAWMGWKSETPVFKWGWLLVMGWKSQTPLYSSGTTPQHAWMSWNLPTPVFNTINIWLLFCYYFHFVLRRMRKNKALAHHTSTFFHTCRVLISMFEGDDVHWLCRPHYNILLLAGIIFRRMGKNKTW